MAHPVVRLLPGEGVYHHRFGGPIHHHGAVPPGREHPVHLLFELDLTDPELGLAPRFSALSRLPLCNAIQYNCCDMVYRVISDDAIEIAALSDDDVDAVPDWYKDFPYDNYPGVFPELAMVAAPVPAEVGRELEDQIGVDGSAGLEARLGSTLKRDYRTARIGGRHFMWQGRPEWRCFSPGCEFNKRRGNDGKEVFAVVWERPVPGVHLWSKDTRDEAAGRTQIIFSRCVGCGAIHSCNRCD